MGRSISQDVVQKQSLDDPKTFWGKHAEFLYWHKKPSIILEEGHKTIATGVKHPHWSWFPDGQISTDYNCLDRHVQAGNGDQTAIIWDSPVTKTGQKYTYSQVLAEVESLAAVLRNEGVKKGDVVLIYMPMIPAALFGILATVRLGAIHAVVFGGFAPASLAQRIEASKARVILTASCGIEGTKKPTSYQPFVRGAVEASKWKPRKVIVWQREQSLWENLSEAKGERDWQKLVELAKKNGDSAQSVPVNSGDGLYIIYTSGTTGLPKGVLRYAGGHAVGLMLSMAYLFGIRGPGDVMFCASDIGWVVGHAYILYAPLLAGATTILFEGKPIGTPDAGTFWRILSEYKVNTFFTAPTALRAIRREDPENKYFAKYGEQGGLKNLQALFLAGERSEPSIVSMYQDLLQKYARKGAQVIDHWWSSESGSPMTGIALMPSKGDVSGNESEDVPLQMKAGSAGKPMPGWDIRVVDDAGREIEQGTMGNIVLNMPLSPTGFTTLFNDEERFYKGYLKRFDGKWLDTGDAGMIDQDGYVHVMSRSDDIINVAAHRFSTGKCIDMPIYCTDRTGSIEQVIASNPGIAEVSVYQKKREEF